MNTLLFMFLCVIIIGIFCIYAVYKFDKLKNTKEFIFEKYNKKDK
ncbi:MAG: hypothetical protein ACERKK_09780 [Poseidonibacter sp.]